MKVVRRTHWYATVMQLMRSVVQDGVNRLGLTLGTQFRYELCGVWSVNGVMMLLLIRSYRGGGVFENLVM